MDERKDITIVLVEDDPGHALLIEKNLRRAGVANAIVPFADGQAAMAFVAHHMSAEGGWGVPPFLVLLDLNLPRLDGYQVLKRMKGDERTREVPVVILTMTDKPDVVMLCYKLGCNVFITKPVDADQFSEVILKLGKFLTIIKVPEVNARHD